MGSRLMNFPSPRGVHVPESYYTDLDPDDPYHRPSSLNRRNRYSRSVQQTPRIRNATWITSPGQVTPQTPLAPQSPWLTPQLAPSSPAHRLLSPIPPSPVPTVGEHMTLDELAFAQDDIVDPYPPSRPQRSGLIKSLWRGFKKLSGLQPSPSFPIPRPSLYESRTVEIPMPVPSAPSEATQYVDPTPETSGTDDHRSASPYASPYVRPASIGATPAAIPGSLRASPIPVPSMEIPPPITVISPSDPSTPLSNVTRSIRIPTPGPSQRNLPLGVQEPVTSMEEGSQTLHEPVYPDAVLPQPVSTPIAPILRTDNVKFPQPSGIQIQNPPIERSPSRGSRSSTMTRFRRFVADIDGLPWIADSQIANEYIPENNPRSRLRARLRKGAEPSWYNPRPEVENKPAYWSEWDMWAKQSTAALWDGTLDGRVGWAGVGAGGGVGQGNGQWGPGQWGMVYPHGYAPVQPETMYPSGYPPPGAVNDQSHSPVLP